MADTTDEQGGGDRVAPRVLLGGASDERLVALARAGDEQAFAAIFERYAADVVSAIRAAGSAEGAGGRAYNIGGGSPVSLNAALEQLAALAGRPLDVTRAERESGDVLNTAADTSRAREELGFAPATGLAEGLRAEFEWVLARTERRPRLAAVGAQPG